MYTCILDFLLCSLKIETLFQKLKDQKLQIMQLSTNKTLSAAKSSKSEWFIILSCGLVITCAKVQV